MEWNKYLKYSLHWLPAMVLLLFVLVKIFTVASSFWGEENPSPQQEISRKQSAYQEIPELGQSRSVEEPKPQPISLETTPKPTEQPPFPRARFVLQGISMDADNKKAYFFDKEKNEIRELYLGERLQGYELHEVESQRVRFQGVEEWFYLFPQPEKGHPR